MAAQHIPGAFPSSIPPTPADEPVQQPRQYPEEQDQGHHHRELNKLPKATDSRGHAHTDSGVNFTESETIQPAKGNNDRWVGPSEAVGGGTYVRDDVGPYQTSQPADDGLLQPRQLAKENSDEEFPIRRNNANEKPLGAAAVGAGAEAAIRDHNTIDSTDITPRRSHEQRSDPPYWGDLPKASSGGIYNTVTGHGSAQDDHDQHHHLPQRSAASETSHIVGTADFPRGTGVYNSVSGHGSQDAESRRHSQAATTGDRNATAGGPGGTVLPAPLSEIPEGQQKQTFSETDRSNVPPSSLPHSVSRDNAFVAAPGSGPTDREINVSRQSPTQRAFPLSSSPKNARDDEATSTSNSRNAALAGTAALGAGAAAYGMADKNRNDKDAQNSHTETQARHLRSSSEDQGTRAAGGLLSRKPRDDRRNSSVDKHRSRSRSVQGEKKHKVLGIFTRHKDEERLQEDTSTHEPPAQQAERKPEPVLVGSTTGTTKTRNRLRKGSRSEPKDRRASSDSPTDTDNSNHNSTKAAAGAAAGAGAFGLLHHKKDKDGKVTEDQNTRQEKPSFSSHPNQPLASQAPASNTAQVRQPRSSGVGSAVGLDAVELAHKHDPAHPVPGTAVPVGLATHKHDDPSTPFEHPREPPSPPHDDPKGSRSWVPAAVVGAAASGAPLAMRQSRDSTTANTATNQHPDTNVVYNTLPSGVQSNSTNISPRGSAVHESINTSRPVANAPGDYNVFASSSRPLSSNHPSESNNTHTGSSTQEPAYNHLSSSTPSGVALGSARQSEPHGSRTGVITQEPGAYNHLASGTTSGVKSDQSTDNSNTARHSTEGQINQEPDNYNHLSSGNASGIAAAGAAAAGAAGVAAHKARGSTTETSRQGNLTQDSGQYKHLPSGTESGIKRDAGPTEGSRAHDLAASGSNRPSQNRTDSGPYNKLPSGTPSGVKIKPKDNSRRATEPTVQTHDQHSSGRNVSSPTGPTGVPFTQHHRSQPSNIDTRDSHLKDLPLPASSSSPTNAHPSSHHTVVSPPVHAAPETGKATNPPPAAGESATLRYTSFPSTAKGMSPEVMPDTYRESVTKPHEQQGMSPEVMPEAYRESVSRPADHSMEMNPEVMPNAYRSSVPRDSNNNNNNNNNSDLKTRGMQPVQSEQYMTGQNKFVSPALAAATGAWAASSGTGNGNVGGVGTGNVNVPQGKVMHKCEHCGRDNDISGYVKEAVNRVTGVDRF